MIEYNFLNEFYSQTRKYFNDFSEIKIKFALICSELRKMILKDRNANWYLIVCYCWGVFTIQNIKMCTKLKMYFKIKMFYFINIDALNRALLIMVVFDCFNFI